MSNVFKVVNEKGQFLDFDGSLTAIGDGATFTGLSEIDNWAEEMEVELTRFSHDHGSLIEVPGGVEFDCEWFNYVNVFAIEYSGLNQWYWRKTINGWAINDDGEWILEKNLSGYRENEDESRRVAC